MADTWVVVADSSRARLFVQRGRTLEEFADRVNPEGRMNARELDADRGGRSFDIAGAGRHAMGREHDTKETRIIGFAKDIADEVGGARGRGDIDALVLVAPPEFLGHLRAALDEQSARLVRRSIDKNLVQLDAAHLAAEVTALP
jgi:protein required for attachment to host cells